MNIQLFEDVLQDKTNRKYKQYINNQYSLLVLREYDASKNKGYNHIDFCTYIFLWQVPEIHRTFMKVGVKQFTISAKIAMIDRLLNKFAEYHWFPVKTESNIITMGYRGD